MRIDQSVSPFTVHGWFKPSAVGDVNTFVAFRNGTDFQYRLQSDPNTEPANLIQFLVLGENSEYGSADAYQELTAGEWVFLAFFWNGASIGVSVNGSEWVTGSAPVSPKKIEGAWLVVGDYDGSASNVLAHRVKFVEGVLTHSEIASVYAAGVGD